MISSQNTRRVKVCAAGLLGLVMGYVLAIGPECHLVWTNRMSEDAFRVINKPVLWLGGKVPILGGLLTKYALLWYPSTEEFEDREQGVDKPSAERNLFSVVTNRSVNSKEMSELTVTNTAQNVLTNMKGSSPEF